MTNSLLMTIIFGFFQLRWLFVNDYFWSPSVETIISSSKVGICSYSKFSTSKFIGENSCFPNRKQISKYTIYRIKFCQLNTFMCESDINARWVQYGHIVFLPLTQPLFTQTSCRSGKRKDTGHLSSFAKRQVSVFFPLKFPFKLVWVRNLPTLENLITIFFFIISICFSIMTFACQSVDYINKKSIKLLTENRVNITFIVVSVGGHYFHNSFNKGQYYVISGCFLVKIVAMTVLCHKIKRSRNKM